VSTFVLTAAGGRWFEGQGLRSRIEALTFRLLAMLQNVAASLDPDILQWPGGSIIAPALWLFGNRTMKWCGQ
jgi:hypothetical protein